MPAAAISNVLPASAAFKTIFAGLRTAQNSGWQLG